MHELDKAIFEVFTGSGGTIAANLRPYFSLVLEVYGAFEIIHRFIQWRKREERKRNLKRSLALTFQKKLDKARSDLEKLADDVAYAFGALFMYSVAIPPFEPKKKARDIIKQLENDYIEMTKSMQELMRLVKKHKKMIVSALELDETQVMLLEGLSEAFEKEKPDIEALTDYLPLIAQEMQKTEKERKDFSRELAKGIGKFNSASGLIVINHALGINSRYKRCFKKAARYGLKEFSQRFNECRFGN
ncbi:hypothetical protein [Thermococcus gorgonarius]|uniref:Uncharacterized protein n=1 Tax=Thermococcus gorgonarius TaxID=71997 RepID=A0A2Z2M5K6_THEGO|nr:hypothetical protein [Thermococcus gorgonarius]ASJ00339.1 hypothetical protein A3K92_02005 [Thermococcus gorgonarius]